MLGATLGALLTSVMDSEYIVFEGDSAYVCGLLDGTYTPRETFFFNCLELSKDLLGSRFWRAEWISREHNTVCDALARRAVEENALYAKYS
jgi:ribonuclease HI